MNWALCNSTDSEGQGSLAGCSLWGCKDSDTTEWTIAQKGILAMCPEKIRGTTNPNLNVTSESQVHCAIYWGESAHVNILCSWSELRNGLQWPSSCHEEVKPCWNLPLPGLPQPAHGGRVGEVRIFPQVSGRGSARHLQWERRDGERACVLHHTQLGSPVHIFSSKPSPHSSWGVDYPVWLNLCDEKMRWILASYVVYENLDDLARVLETPGQEASAALVLWAPLWQTSWKINSG